MRKAIPALQEFQLSMQKKMKVPQKTVVVLVTDRCIVYAETGAESLKKNKVLVLKASLPVWSVHKGICCSVESLQARVALGFNH